MSISVGDKFPSVTLKALGPEGMTDINTGELLAGKKTVLFAVPGAFTPSCHLKHLPGYVSNADSLKGKGVDQLVCVSVNDPFVMKAWGEAVDPDGKVMMLPDWNAELTKALGLDMDGSGAGLGQRAKRFSMTLEDGVVKSLEVEEKASEVTVSGAEACLAKF